MERRIRIVHLTPVIITIILAAVLAPIFLGSKTLNEIETPFSKEPGLYDVLYNATTFLLLVMIGATSMYFLTRKRKIGLLKLMFRVVIFMVLLCVVQIYLALAWESIGFTIVYSDLLELLLHLVLAGIMFTLLMTSENEILNMSIVILYGVTFGLLFSVILPIWSIVVIVSMLSVYDLYSVFKGPLKALIDTFTSDRGGGRGEGPTLLDELLKGLIVRFKGIRLGAGDILFYSLLIGSTYRIEPYNPIYTLASGLGVLLGSFITLQALKRRRAMPALPLPALLSLALLGLSYVLINF